ncbi:hypothetical protein PQX77_002742 [Marasmius sp. AFHP31]|nr:hypothetical protein PQX77_002742 [Marasmius sp. AFHP31]
MVENFAKNTLEYAESLHRAVAEDHCGNFEVGMGPEESLEGYMPWSPFVDEGCKSTALPGELVTLLKKTTLAGDERRMYELYSTFRINGHQNALQESESTSSRYAEIRWAHSATTSSLMSLLLVKTSASPTTAQWKQAVFRLKKDDPFAILNSEGNMQMGSSE